MKAILSDQHCHSWSQFAKTDSNGVNTRLTIILDEMERAADELLAAGGKEMFFAGDLFHVRGSIDPEVFNPTQERIRRILDKGVSITAIPGNHDLKSRNTTAIGNAMQSLDALKGFQVVTGATICHRTDTVMVPWVHSLDELENTVVATKFIKDSAVSDLIIHAPLNSVLPGLPATALDPLRVKSWGFRRVFCGHYHNHKEVLPGVFSIGATTHQTWGDIGSKAGFLLIDDEKVTWRASRAPSFVELDEATREEDIPLIVDGNYVRVRGLKMTERQVSQMNKELHEMGALGTSFQIAREAASVRTGGMTTLSVAPTLKESIGNYIDGLKLDPDIATTVQARCDDILSSVSSAARIS